MYFDGASNVQKAGDILKVNYTRMTVCHCSEHVVALFFSDVFNSLTAIDAREHQLFNKLLWPLVTSPIFVRCQRLMTRKIDDLFGLNHGLRRFYAACCFDELSRWSVLCLLNASFKTAVSQHHNLVFLS